MSNYKKNIKYQIYSEILHLIPYIILIIIFNIVANQFLNSKCTELITKYIASYKDHRSLITLFKHINMFVVSWFSGEIAWFFRGICNLFFNSRLQYQLDKTIINYIKNISPEIIQKNGSNDFRSHASMIHTSVTKIIHNLFIAIIPSSIFTALLLKKLYHNTHIYLVLCTIGWILGFILWALGTSGYITKNSKNNNEQRVKYKKQLSLGIKNYIFHFLYGADQEFLKVVSDQAKSSFEAKKKHETGHFIVRTIYDVILFIFGALGTSWIAKKFIPLDISVSNYVLFLNLHLFVILKVSYIIRHLIQLQAAFANYNTSTEALDSMQSKTLGNKNLSECKEIVINNLSFQRNDIELFNNLNLNIKKGEKVAVLGHSGCGKSTLFNILLGLNKSYGGSVSYDHQDLKNIKSSSIRQYLTYIAQDNHLYQDTLRYNLTMGINKFQDMQIFKVLQEVQLYDFVNNLPDKLDHKIGSDGYGLSGGQKKMIQIARAILFNEYYENRRSGIYLIDEMTVGLDIETANKCIQSVLNNAKKYNQTVLAITHNINLLKYFDKILFCDKNNQWHFDTMQNLMRLNPNFRKNINI